jgi:hypothetical protein
VEDHARIDLSTVGEIPYPVPCEGAKVRSQLRHDLLPIRLPRLERVVVLVPDGRAVVADVVEERGRIGHDFH